jgi:germination protein YpeB
MGEHRIRWITAGLIFALIAVAAWGYGQFREARSFKTAAENSRQQAFYNLLERTEKLNSLTGKMLVSSQPGQTSMVMSDVWRQASMAVEDLSRLPLAHFELTSTARFLSQVGDLAHTMARKSAAGEQLSSEQWNSLVGIRKRLGTLYEQLIKVQERASTGELRWVELAREANRRLPEERPEPMDEDMSEMEKEVQKFPELIYDGPFSDHLLNPTPRGLGGETVSAKQASLIARRFMFGSDRADQFQLDYQGKAEGPIPVHTFKYDPEGEAGEPALIDVSVRGGKVVMLLRSRNPETAELSLEEATKKGLEFLDSKGITSMRPTYQLREGNTAVTAYAYVQEGVTIYPDLIKVKVALDNGEVLSYEAMGFLMNHRERTLPEPKLTIDEAMQELDDRLQVANQRAAVIPLPDGSEAFTYEFNIRLNEDDFLVYINAQSGQEEQVLQLVHAPEGELTQ